MVMTSPVEAMQVILAQARGLHLAVEEARTNGCACGPCETLRGMAMAMAIESGDDS
jgi:hypothetical protein